MRRADRLFEILQLLRGGRLRTARSLGEELEVSTRTIWRDITDLQSQGVPISGERGIGYVLHQSYFLPPLALTQDEMEALIWGTRLVETFGDEALAKAARELQIKIADVSPEDRRRASSGMAAFASHRARAARGILTKVRAALHGRRRLAIAYRDLGGRESERVIRPLNLEFWGQVWTLTAWCEQKDDFRVFRCDRIAVCDVLSDGFRDEPGKRFADFLARMEDTKPHA